jgi:diacylglycerol kinase (ATP)
LARLSLRDPLLWLNARVRIAAILGLGSSEKDLKPFQQNSTADWLIGLPETSDQTDIILIFGGDGTIHRHLSQLVKLQRPVLVVPRGSGNDFARALGIRSPQDSLAAWNKFVSGGKNVRSIDVGVIQSFENPTRYYFCCVANVGLDAEVARRANLLPRWLRGHGGYVASLPFALLRFSPAQILVESSDDGTAGGFLTRSDQPTMLAAFANTPVYGGGMKIAPHARLDDGKFDVCVVRDIAKLKLLSLFPAVYFGRHLSISGVDSFQARRLRVSSERPQDVYADGEYVCRTPVEI